MNPYYQDEQVVLHHGDCIEVMRTLADNSIDSIVTDPPYGLGFMGKEWDSLPPGKEWAEECLRVLKPGGHLLAFGGTRTWHRLAVAIEDAGLEIRDSIAWLYGSGFPKSQNVSKAIDKAAGAEREVIGKSARHGGGSNAAIGDYDRYAASGDVITAPATPEAQQWEGWGTALKPAFEPVVVGRKPLIGTVAANILTHGTGALNIDASRIGTDSTIRPNGPIAYAGGKGLPGTIGGSDSGRFPANVILDDSQAEALDEQSGTLTSGKRKAGTYRGLGYMGSDAGDYPAVEGDTGGASRFFYCAKAPKSERPVVDGVAHETVKPLTLMRYLVKLVTQPGGTVLEPFAGSGTTVEACMLEGFHVIGIEKTDRYLPLIDERVRRTKARAKAESETHRDVPFALFEEFAS